MCKKIKQANGGTLLLWNEYYHICMRYYTFTSSLCLGVTTGSHSKRWLVSFFSFVIEEYSIVFGFQVFSIVFS